MNSIDWDHYRQWYRRIKYAFNNIDITNVVACELLAYEMTAFTTLEHRLSIYSDAFLNLEHK